MAKYLVKDFMTRNPVVLDPEATIQEAALKMGNVDCGVFPVGTKGDPVGILTDRDIVLRAVARGMNMEETRVKDIMSDHIHAIPEDASIHQAADSMRRNNISRLLVNDAKGNVVGILSLGHMIRNADTETITKMVEHALTKKAA